VKIYLVGGAVRDQLLDLPVRDRDWVVVGATEKEMLEQGFRRADVDFPVFLHSHSGEEYALARRETKTGPGYKGFEVYAGPDVTLEQDLVRRDLTINALARDEAGQLVDLFNGQQDLEQGLLRHISPAFVEDPVRLLRVARFAARLGRWGFRVAHGTHNLMQQMAVSDDLLALRPERLWLEMKWALGEDQPWHFFEVLQRCGALARLMPELDQVLAPSAGHGKGGEQLVIQALQRAAASSPAPQVRFAVAFFAATAPLEQRDAFLRRLRAERDHAELLQLLLALNGTCAAAASGEPEALLTLLERGRAQQLPKRFRHLLDACMALHPELKQTLPDRVSGALQVIGEVTARSLQQQGFSGRELGEALRRQRLRMLQSMPDPV